MTSTEIGLCPIPARRLAIVLLSAVIAALAFAAPAGAVQTSQAPQEPQGRSVEAIRVEGNVRLDDATIGFFLAIRAGAAFDWETAQQDYMALYNTLWFRNLIMRWEEGEHGGVIVVIEVDEFPLLSAVRIEGTGAVDTDELFERMELLDRTLTLQEPVNESLLRDAKDILRVMLQSDKGLQFVQIDMALEESADGVATAVFNVIEGDEVRIAQVMFEGNTVFGQRELRWALKRTGEHNFMSFLSKNDRFSLGGYEADMVGITNMYFKKGYINFRYGDPRVEIFNDERELWWGDKLRLAVTIPIFEGPQFYVNELRVTGNTQFSSEELLSILDLESGEIMNVEQVQAAKDAIEAKYADAGYLQISVAPFPIPVGEDLVDVEYRVAENAVYRVNRIEFSGNTNTRDQVLRRNMNIEEMARWDQGRFASSVERLFRLGYFQDVQQDLQAVPPGETLDVDLPADEQYGSVDVDLEVQEVGRNQITFGGGLSALEGGFIQAGYTTRNLFGYGQTLSLYAQVGRQRQNIRLSFADPYFLGKRLRFGADLFRDALNYPDFQREGTGFSLRLGKPMNFQETLALFTEYNYEVIDIGDVSPTLGSLSSSIFQQLFLIEGRRVTSSVRPFLFWNNTDNPYLPSAGNRSTVSYEYAGGALGGTLDFWKASLRTTWWVPLVSEGSGILRQPKQIFAFNIRLDWAQPHGGLEEIPIFERFFLGGSNSVRGTRLRSIGPTDDRGNILGGTRAIQYNLEYIFSLTPSFRVKAFHDAGQAWLEADAVSLKDMRRTVGLEFEVFAPVFNVPFRFFWAYNFKPLEFFGEKKSAFEFAIGSTF